MIRRTTTSSMPHDFETNVVRISAHKNPQKQRKPNPIPSRRSSSYWDLGGRYQDEYDARLDMLPEVGIADTVAGEIFRAVTKIYYDLHNNAMVNNTSGAINYLVEVGVLPPPPSSSSSSRPSSSSSSPSSSSCRRSPPSPPSRASRDDVPSGDDHRLGGGSSRTLLDDVYSTIHPYAIGARVVHIGGDDDDDGAVVARALEALVDATIEHLASNPMLDVVPTTSASSSDDCRHRDRRDADVRTCLERCALRNRIAAEMYHARAAASTTATTTTTMMMGSCASSSSWRDGGGDGPRMSTTMAATMMMGVGANKAKYHDGVVFFDGYGGGGGDAGRRRLAQDRATAAAAGPSSSSSSVRRHDPTKNTSKKGGRNNKKKWNNKKGKTKTRGVVETTKGGDAITVELSKLDLFEFD